MIALGSNDIAGYEPQDYGVVIDELLLSGPPSARPEPEPGGVPGPAGALSPRG